MKFDSKQQAIISDIFIGKTIDLKSFFENHPNVKIKSSINLSHFILKPDWSNDGLNKGYLPDNKKELLEDFKRYISVIDFLEENSLIKTFPRDDSNSENRLYPVIKAKNGNNLTFALDQDFIPIMNNLREKQFVCKPELDDFIQNKYKTAQEIKEESEKSFRDKTIKNTYIAIAITFLSMIITASINLWSGASPDKEKNVKISNPQEFRDTLKIMIENKIFNNTRDTSKIKDSTK